MLKKVRKLDYSRPSAYAPHAVDAIVDTEELAFVEPVETRRQESCVKLTFRCGATMDCIGVPDDFVT